MGQGPTGLGDASQIKNRRAAKMGTIPTSLEIAESA